MRIRIAHKLLAVFLLVGLVPMAVGVYFLSQQLQAYQQLTVGELARARVERVSNRLSDKLNSILDVLANVQRRLSVSDEDQAILHWPYDQFPELLQLLVTDAEHRVVSVLSRFGFVAKGSLFEPVDKSQEELPELAFELWNLEPQLHVHKPVTDLVTGQEFGMLHADLSLKGLFEELTAGPEETRPPYIVSDNGQVVSHADINLVLTAADLSDQALIRALRQGEDIAQAEYLGSDGVAVLGVGMRIPGLPLFVVKEVAVEQAYALSRKLFRDTSVVFVLLALLLILVAVLLSRSITRPLEVMEQGTRRVEQGELDFVIDGVSDDFPDELNDLTDRFNLMLSALGQDRRFREQVERELLRLQHYLRNIIDSMPSLLIGVDTEMRVTHWNREAERVTGASAEAAVGRPLTEVYPQISGRLDNVRQAIASGKPLSDRRVAAGDAQEQHFTDVTIYPLATDSVEGAVIRIDDVTEQVRLQETLIQSEKMLTVGGLAAGMAHEINNPLAGVMQNTQVMRSRLRDDMPKNREVAEQCGLSMPALACYLEQREILPMMDMVMASGQRAAKIVSNMLSFSRKSDSGFLPEDLHLLLEETLELAANDYDLKKRYDFRHIEIRRHFDPALPKVACDKGKIQQVVLNLLKNGAQAMAGDNASGRAPRFELRTRHDDKWARIEIEDNGPGIAPEVRKRIFEPFYTTKEVGFGTGLGLSVSYFIMQQNHGGSLEVRSEPGQGACFIIKLPLKRAALDEAESEA